MTRRARPRPVFSIWAWLVLSPYLLTALGGVDGATTAHEWTVGAVVSVVVHLVVLGYFLAIGAIERRIASRRALRWSLVVVALLVISFGRPFLITALQNLAGVDLIPSRFLARTLLNLFVFAIGCLLVYALGEVIRRNLDARGRLLAVLGQLETQAAGVEAVADRIADDFQREVRDPVLDALGALVRRDLPPRELSDELRWTAHAVVRPLSHRAASSELEDALADLRIDVGAGAVAVSVRDLLQPSRVVPAAPWLSTLVGILLLLPPVLNAHGLGLGLGLASLGTAVSLAASLLIRILPMPRSAVGAIILLSGLELLAGAAVLWVLIGPMPMTPITVFYFAYGTLGYATAAVVLALIGSGVRELRANQERTAEAVAAAERRAFDARRRLAAESETTGRMLHNEVQGDLIATSLQLRLGTAGEDPLGRLIDRVGQLLERPVGVDEDAPTTADSIRESITASLAAWSLSLDLAVDVDPEALDRLARRPRAAAVAHDAITEGLTNAVRHGRGERAAVAIRRADGVEEAEGGVLVEVANPGRIAGINSGGGIGLQDLDARARSVSLSQDGGSVVLRVVV